MEQIKRIRVAMVCHLSNANIRSHLPLDDGNSFPLIRKLLGKPRNNRGYSDLAVWNTILAECFGKRDDIDFHIISAHPGMKKQVVRYTDSDVHYTFLNHHFASLLKLVIKNPSVWRKVNPFSKKVKKEINRINPDLVVLMGTETPYYSSTVLGIKKYPVYAMCQTVYNNPARKEYGMWNLENVETELDLFRELKYIGVYCKMHYELVRANSPQSFIFRFHYPNYNKLLIPVETQKEYDFINFALSMDSRKGFPDAIQALAIVKRKFPDVKMNLIGSCPEEKKRELVDMIASLGLQNNVVFTPFFEKQTDLFLHIQKSRFAVLPCKVDNISGTMSQAMQLGLPIVVYNTTGTPSLNREKQCALIAEKENVEELAQHMLSLMENPALADELRINAREWQEERYEADRLNDEHIIENFRAIIENFYNGVEIPQEQLFDPEKDD